MSTLEGKELSNLLNEFSQAAGKRFKGCGEEHTAWMIALDLYYCDSPEKKQAYFNRIIKGLPVCQNQ